MKDRLQDFKEKFLGEFHFDSLHKTIYATDASVYRKIPLAVAYPRDEQALKQLLGFAKQNGVTLIPRAAGTSLAGQCVGDGIVVDVSKHFTRILSFDPDSRTVTVQPGVIRDELNAFLKPHRLFFSPDTSTANRSMIGGMVGNNSSGTTSIRYGVTRDKVISLKTILPDGSEAVFKACTREEFLEKAGQNSREGEIYKTIYEGLRPPEVREEIKKQFPKPEIHRRNTGYAIDSLTETSLFGSSDKPVNLCNLLCGSEGTLAFITEITLQLDALPPPFSAMAVAHYNSLEACLNDVTEVMNHSLYTCEMMDDIILERTRHNKTYRPYRFFVKGNPKSLLLLELKSDSETDLKNQVSALIKTLEKSGRSYAFPVLYHGETRLALELRKAGLGLLGNLVSDKKAVACIEDTAVAIEDLPGYIAEFTAIMEKYRQQAVYYAHAGAGELHLRPILNLKEKGDTKLFRKITREVALLCKKYGGSFSGEHGDGIVRSEFIPLMIGDSNYEILRKIKTAFDPAGIMNRGKIIDPFPMDSDLRYIPGREEPEISSFMDFSDYNGILRLAENCNGSGDCRKTEHAAGAMCPSYHATRNEKDSTRARANMLREVLTTSDKLNRFDSADLKEVLDLCISCKACASECPSNVDISIAKAEFLYQYKKANGASFSDRFFAKSSALNKKAGKFPKISNWLFKNSLVSSLIKKTAGIHSSRSLPEIPLKSMSRLQKEGFFNPENYTISAAGKGRVFLFADEFTNYLDVETGVDAYELLVRLGYEVEVICHLDSGRALISKGFLEEARQEADRNIRFFKDKISSTAPLVGIEPSAILSFRDEYLRLATDKKAAGFLAENSFLIEEFLASEIENGKISAELFTREEKEIKIHSHCHQKSLSNQKVSFDILNLPENYRPVIIPSGCCGMAGSFGYEKKHYEVSMKIGELVLFPAVRKTPQSVCISANGTSCRHQILDGTGRRARHPVSILKEALI